MRLTSELTVDAPLERTWPALLELGGVVRVDLDGEYVGTATLDDADEDEHAAGFHAQARETAGPGLVAAWIAARLSESDGATRVVVETELRLTGGPQPDQEGIQRRADELVARVAGRLAGEEHEQADHSVTEPARELLAVKGEPPAPRSESPPLKGSDPYPSQALKGSALVILGAVIGLVLGRLLWRRE